MFRWLVIAYLLGSIPNSYIFARWFGKKDIRHVGSRNAGATNVAMNVGWLPGMLTLATDIAKGYLAAIVGGLSSIPMLPFLAPAAAIAGHNWPIWLRFRGGGGLATLIGGCLALTGLSVPLAGLALWGILYLFCRDHDKSAAMACIVLPVGMLAAQQSAETVAFVTSSGLVILVRRLQSMVEKVRRWRQEEQAG